MQERDSFVRVKLLMLACDIPLCLFGKVKIKTVKVECVSQHVHDRFNVLFTSAKVILFLLSANISSEYLQKKCLNVIKL